MSSTTNRNIAGFPCEITSSGPQDSSGDHEALGIVFLHGYGADMSQGKGVLNALLQASPSLAQKSIKLVCPLAPTMGGMNSWYPLDVMGLMSSFQAGEAALAACRF